VHIIFVRQEYQQLHCFWPLLSRCFVPECFSLESECPIYHIYDICVCIDLLVCSVFNLK
jgi:hypothetical protein